ncbi:short-chain dehydrogenase, partial [Burkholderia cenocepacia]|nr:short-chain dehydrogenase [Burkholderia cenocepacia]
AAQAIARQHAFRVIPWQMGVVAKVLHVLPRWLYDRLFEKAPRKPKAGAH